MVRMLRYYSGRICLSLIMTVGAWIPRIHRVMTFITSSVITSHEVQISILFSTSDDHPMFMERAIHSTLPEAPPTSSLT
jgi:hypothetical protein